MHIEDKDNVDNNNELPCSKGLDCKCGNFVEDFVNKKTAAELLDLTWHVQDSNCLELTILECTHMAAATKFLGQLGMSVDEIRQCFEEKNWKPPPGAKLTRMERIFAPDDLD